MKTNKSLKLINYSKILNSKFSGDFFIIDGLISNDFSGSDFEILDLDNCILCPGFIDPQVNGLNDFSFWDFSEDDFSKIDKLRIDLAYQGVTAFCPTIITNAKAKVLKSIDLINRYLKSSTNNPGAKILGIHIEGIFITKYGVHDKNFSNFNLSSFNVEPYIKDNVILFTLAPELDKTGEAIKLLKDSNISVSIGHTNATYKEGLVAIEQYGLNLCTHMFNAMRGFNGFNHRDNSVENLNLLKRKLEGRDPINPDNDGILLALLKSSNVTAMSIPDGIHVSSNIVKYLFELKSKDKYSITTDMVSTPFFKQSEALGDLGGGQTYFDKCISNLQSWNVSNLEDILTSASTSISKVLYNSHNYSFGQIQLGELANLAIWDLKTSTLKGTIIGKNLFLNF